jgi:hypothetical protein
MSLDTSVLVLAMDDRIWVDSDSLIEYLREVERQAQEHLVLAQERQDQPTAVAAYSSGEMVRQIADGLVLTTMVAHDKIRTKRESRR